jgi:hypothetical protein
LLVFSNNTILFKVSSVTPQQLNNTIGRRWYFGNEGMNFVKESKWIKKCFCAGGGQVGMSFSLWWHKWNFLAWKTWILIREDQYDYEKYAWKYQMKIEKSTFITKIKTKMILFVPENAKLWGFCFGKTWFFCAFNSLTTSERLIILYLFISTPSFLKLLVIQNLIRK